MDYNDGRQILISSNFKNSLYIYIYEIIIPMKKITLYTTVYVQIITRDLAMRVSYIEKSSIVPILEGQHTVRL